MSRQNLTEMTATPNLTTNPPGEPAAGPCYSTLSGDPDLAELVALFVSELPQRLADIRQAAQEQNWQEARRLSHQLRGAGGSYGYVGTQTTNDSGVVPIPGGFGPLPRPR